METQGVVTKQDLTFSPESLPKTRLSSLWLSHIVLPQQLCALEQLDAH